MNDANSYYIWSLSPPFTLYFKRHLNSKDEEETRYDLMWAHMHARNPMMDFSQKKKKKGGDLAQDTLNEFPGLDIHMLRRHGFNYSCPKHQNCRSKTISHNGKQPAYSYTTGCLEWYFMWWSCSMSKSA